MTTNITTGLVLDWTTPKYRFSCHLTKIKAIAGRYEVQTHKSINETNNLIQARVLQNPHVLASLVISSNNFLNSVSFWASKSVNHLSAPQIILIDFPYNKIYLPYKIIYLPYNITYFPYHIIDFPYNRLNIPPLQ